MLGITGKGMRCGFAAILLLTCSVFAAGEPLVDRAFDHFSNLEYDQALEIFRSLARRDPGNPDFRNHLAQTILYRELYRVGALESELVSGSNPFLRRPKVEPSEADRREFTEAIAESLALTERRLAENPNDIEALYVRGVSLGLKSNYDFLVRKAWMDALRSATDSRKLHQRILEIEPSHVDARMIPAIHDYVVGSLPWYIKVIGFLAGFRGDKQGGIATLERVARDGVRQRDNARFLLAAVYRRERRAKDAVPLIEALIRDFPRNYILRMEMVQMYSDLGDKEKGLAVVREIERLKSSGAPGYDRMPWHKLWYTRGTLLFWYLDLEPALADFRRMVETGEEMPMHTEQLAWYRVGQTQDMLGRRQEAMTAYRHVIEIAPDSERAKQARYHLRKPCTKDNRS